MSQTTGQGAPSAEPRSAPSVLDQAIEGRQRLGVIPDRVASPGMAELMRDYPWRPGDPWRAAAWAAGGRAAGMVLPRLAGPVPQFAWMLLPHIVDALRGAGGIRLGLAFREAFSPTSARLVLSQRLPERAEFIVPGWWEQIIYGCDTVYEATETAAASAGYCFKIGFPGATPTPWVGFHHTYDLQTGTAYETEENLGPWSFDPSRLMFNRGAKFAYTGVGSPTGGDWPAPVPAEAFPRWERAAGSVPVYSPEGLGSPSEASRDRAVVSRVVRTGMAVAPLGGLSWAEQAAVHAAGEEFGVREVHREPERAPPARPAYRSSWLEMALGMPSVQVRPDVRFERPHRFARPPAGVRERKIRFGTPYVAAAFVINAFTESNDFLREIWKTLPRRCRTAKQTRSGNRRTDAMLADLYRCWSHIDWDEASVNLQVNDLEDKIYGALGLLRHGAMFAAKRGTGLGGFGGDRALDPMWASDRVSDARQEYRRVRDPARNASVGKWYREPLGRGRDPVRETLDWYRERRLTALRRAREAVADRR